MSETEASSPDNRRAERVHVPLTVRWEGVLAAMKGTIGDLSTSGCFVLSEDKVEAEELIRLEIILPRDGTTIYAWGEIVYKVPEIGFGLRFTLIDDEDQKKLDLLLKAEIYRKRRKTSAPAANAAGDESAPADAP